MRAEIIAVGSELLTPHRLDTNSLFLTSELNQLGIRVTYKTVVGDVPDEMRSSFRCALERAEVVVSSGGLGPTDDDRTRQTVAELLSRKLNVDDAVLRHIKERFQRFRPGRVMPEINARQALVPEGATVLPNPNGTAPGLWLEANGHVVILLPGVPGELRGLFETQVKPRLAEVWREAASVYARTAHYRTSRVGSGNARFTALRALPERRDHHSGFAAGNSTSSERVVG